MLNWRSTLNDVEDAGEYAMDQLLSAANSVGKSARYGYKSIASGAKSDAAFWGAISLGMGACAGGMFALWRFATGNPRGKRLVRDGKRIVRSVTKSIDRNTKSVARAVAAANRDMNKFMRSMPLGVGGMSKPAPKRSRKTTRSRSRRRATM